MRGALIVLLLSLPGAAQTFDPEKIRAAMEQSIARQRDAIGAGAEAGMMQSIEKQKAAVRKQPAVPESRETRDGSEFFTTPWPVPSALVPRASASDPLCPPMPETIVLPMIGAAAERSKVNPVLLREMVRQESGFRPCVESSAGAQGLMQLMPSTQSHYGVTNPFDPEQSLEGGAKYLRDLLDRYGGDVLLALGAYNAGPGRVDRAKGVPAIPETQNYVRSILGRVDPP